MSVKKEITNILKLTQAECSYNNARQYRDSQESELRGAVASRANGTDYYADNDDYMIDVRRRVEAWEHWQAKMEKIKAEIFKLCLATGKRSEYLK